MAGVRLQFVLDCHAACDRCLKSCREYMLHGCDLWNRS